MQKYSRTAEISTKVARGYL